jgi:hypothetical protein
MYFNKRYPKSCPCGGAIIWTSWDSDCMWNDGGYKIDCDTCHKSYTPDEAQPLVIKPRKKRGQS